MASDPYIRRTWLVTGGASGIGELAAQRFAELGANVVVWDLAGAALDACPHISTAVDVTNSLTVAAAMNALVAEHGPLYGVLHCAGILRTGSFEQTDLNDHIATVHVNVDGTINVAHAALPYLRESRGSLVLMASASAFYGPPELAVYAATKSAVVSLVQALRIELDKSGVYVGACCPLFTGTPMLDDRSRSTRLVVNVGVAHTTEDVVASLIRGILRRKPMIYPSWRPWVVGFLSRYAGGIGHPMMRLSYKHKQALLYRRDRG